MRPDRPKLTFLHVEDDPITARLVEDTLSPLGFCASIERAQSLEEALGILSAMALAKRRLDLVITDLWLSESSGLDVIRAVKSDPTWKLTPVIILSSEEGPNWIDAAYACGASLFLSKSDIIGALVSFFDCWIEHSARSEAPPNDGLKEAVGRASSIRARVAEYFLWLARISRDTEETEFWLNRALTEGNLSNLLAFATPLVEGRSTDPDLLSRFRSMQDRFLLLLPRLEEQIRSGVEPTTAERCDTVTRMFDIVDIGTVIAIIECLSPASPKATEAFRRHAATQLHYISKYISTRCPEAVSASRLMELNAWATTLLPEATQSGRPR